MLLFVIAGLCASAQVMAEDSGYHSSYDNRFTNDADYGFIAEYVVSNDGYNTHQHTPQYSSQHTPQYSSQHTPQHTPQYSSQHTPEQTPQYSSQHPPQHPPQYNSQHTPERPPQHIPQYNSQHTPEHPPQHTPQYPSQHTPQQHTVQHIPHHHTPHHHNDYVPQYETEHSSSGEHYIPDGGRPFYANRDNLPPEHGDGEVPDYWYKDAEALVRPSETADHTYIPREIMNFREQFRMLKDKYPDRPLLSPDDFYQPKHDRYGRLLGGGNMFTGLMNLLFGGGFISNVALKSPVVTAPVGVGPLPVPIVPVVVGDVPDFVSDYGCDMTAAKAGVLPCNGGAGVCDSCSNCKSNGGTSLGQCSINSGVDMKNTMMGLKTNSSVGYCCCKYEYKSDASTGAAISYFVSPDFPKSTKSAFSTSLTLQIREDVDQILVEFVVFEMASGYSGCSSDDFIEVIAPTTAGGILGDGNNRFCGYNTDQHFYIEVNPGDIIIFKAAVSGTGFIWKEHPGRKKLRKEYEFRNGETRFKLKITQIPFASNEADLMDRFYNNLMQNKKLYKTKQAAIDPYLGMNTEEGSRGFCGMVPEYYEKLRAPAHCRQYYTEIRGTFQNFNYDGKTCLPPNLDYNVCFLHTRNYCGLTLSAITFDIPTGNEKCAKGDLYSFKGTTCCTAGYISKFHEEKNPDKVTKFIGVDGTSDGSIKGVTYSYNQPRYFFCGLNLGKTNFVQSKRRGSPVVKVYSDWHTCDEAKGWHKQKSHGIGFKIKYGIEIGTC